VRFPAFHFRGFLGLPGGRWPDSSSKAAVTAALPLFVAERLALADRNTDRL
jgi:hypothetical protein